MSDNSSHFQQVSPVRSNGVPPIFEPVNEQQLFFENFLNYREINDIAIRGYRIRKQRFSEYAVYIIKVTTMDMTYEIEKRYREFDVLYQTIIENHPKAVLPDFPQKRIFRNLCQGCLEERKLKLGELMQSLHEIHRDYRIYEFLEFIQLFGKYKASKEVYGLVMSFKHLKSHAATKDDFVLMDLLIKLNISLQNRLQTFQKINDFLFEKKPKISTKIVEILIKGEGSLKGLVQILGVGHSENHLVCSIGFKLFCSLFDHEYNKAADFFLEVYSKITPEEFYKMKLGDHITERPAKNCKQYALRLLEYYLETYPNVLNNENISNEVRKEYQKYKNKRSMICQKIESLDKKTDLIPRGNHSLENFNGIKSALIKQDSSFSKLLLFNNNCEKFSSS